MTTSGAVRSADDRLREVSVGGIAIFTGHKEEFLSRLAGWACVHRSAYVCFVTAHMVALASEDGEVFSALCGADLRTPDGTPVAWGAHFLSRSRVDILDGPLMMPLILSMAEEQGLAVGFLGGRSEVLERVVKLAKQRHPRIRITYAVSPPFRELDRGEDEEIVRDIETSGVQLLFVGLGSPKQEKWMSMHRDKVHAVMLGVGAAFDFYAGVKHMPPRWFQCLGLTWLFRLLQEPKRLWRRNVCYIPRFLAIMAHDILRRKSPAASESRSKCL
jgi:N-acetylglucosaminyldiphosphoundecaprenol N-acetyl-beta-D-mannosaminyltransferase